MANFIIFAAHFTNKKLKRMKTMIYKILYLILFIYLPLAITAQTETVISSEEKRDLEKKFQGLKTFYIDSDGTVVYRYNETSTTEPEQAATDNKQNRVKVKVNINEDGEYVVTTEQPDYTFSDSESELHSIPENIQIKDDFEKKKTEKIDKEVYLESLEDFDTDDNDQIIDIPKRKALSKKEPTYKTLEEAALALEDLISQYKQQQSQSRNRGGSSLSKKASGGVDSSIRREYTQNFPDEDTPEYEEVSNGSEPTYYINGVKADAQEYNKLKPEDIRRKERRASKTNPNGEWWVQTR